MHASIEKSLKLVVCLMTLSAIRVLRWGSFTRDIFHFVPNMCCNHVTAIPAANHSQQKYFKSLDVYDTYYDEVVQLSKVGHEVVARMCR
jgi:hypothetical protein